MLYSRLQTGLLLAAALGCALLAGCVDMQTTPAGPTAGGLFPSPPVFTEPGALGPSSAGAIVIAPSQVTAPVGSEVVLVASVIDRNGQPATERRVEWAINPGGTGEFVSVADRDAFTFFGLFGVRGTKISPTYMVGATSPRNVLITRGTPTTADDIRLAPGQTWASVTSPVEGITQVTVYSPDVYGWDQRQRTATIQWVAAAAIPVATVPGPVGAPGTLAPNPNPFTPMAPAAGAAGAIAGAPGAPSLPPGTVPGAAAAPGAPRLPPGTVPGAGVPPGASPGTSPLDVRIAGPNRAEVGGDVQFTITVTNRGQTKATGLMASDRFDAGLKHAVATGAIERPMQDLAPGQSQQFNLSFKVAQQGQLCHTVEITSRDAGRATARSCLTAAAAPIAPQARLTVKKTGPGQVRAGEIAQFFITVTNTGNTQLTNLRLADAYDDMLEPVQATEGYQLGRGELTWTIASLAPGQSVNRQVNCRTRQTGRFTNRATISDSQGNTAADEAALDVR